MIKTGKFNKGLIVVNAYEVLPAVQHMVDRLATELNNLGIEVEVKSNAEILSFIGSNGELYSADLKMISASSSIKIPTPLICLNKGACGSSIRPMRSKPAMTRC
jgi:hypothetical protein